MTAPEANVAAIFYEHPKKMICVKLHARRPYDALHLGAPFRAAGTREEALLRLRERDIVKAEKAVITHVKQQLASLI